MDSLTRIGGNQRISLAILAAALICICLGAKLPTSKDQPLFPFNAQVGSGDWPQLGGTPQRNNAPQGANIPSDWDVKSGKNIKWSTRLGSQTYGNIVVANGKIYVGTNNQAAYLKRYPPHVDLGVLLCFQESDGEFLWQHSSEKLLTGRVHDWPLQGICSAPVVEGERLWFVTSRGEVVCLDTAGFRDRENDGPFTGEQLEKTQVGLEEQHEADVVWKFDMMQELGVRQHNMATCAPTIWGDVLFICTSNGVDETHVNIPAPDAPSFMAMDKRTGKVLWTDNSPGKNILHGQWSCPVAGIFAGVPQVIFPGGDGWLYSFRAERWKGGKPELLWKFDGNPKDSIYQLGGRSTRNGIIAVPVIYDGLVFMTMGEDPEHGEGSGHLWCIDPTRRGDVSPELVVDQKGNVVPHRRLLALDPGEQVFSTIPEAGTWELLDQLQLPLAVRTDFANAGITLPEAVRMKLLSKATQWQIETEIAGVKQEFQLQRRRPGGVVAETGTVLWCAKPSKEKVINNPNSATVWHYDKYDQNQDGKIEFEETMHRSIGSPAMKNHLLFITDFSGLVHCLDARTGKPHWTCDLLAACWTTPLIIGENVYVADEDGDVAIFALSPDCGKSVKTGDPKSGALQEPLREINMISSVYTMPVVANNVLYIASKDHLYAIAAERVAEKGNAK